jgi:queuine/archaeosine tRNA-ribosyltransferase
MVSVHNSHMYLRVMEEIRQHLAQGTFSEFRREFVGGYVPSRRVLLGRVKE